jgi:hypothetical protein
MGAPSSKLCNRLAASPVAVTLLSVVAAIAGSTTAQESFSQGVTLARDPASQPIEQGKLADHPIRVSAVPAKRLRQDSMLPRCHGSSPSTRKPTSPSSSAAACRRSCGLRRCGAPGQRIPRSGISRGWRRTTGISTTRTASLALANSAPRSMSKEWWRNFAVRLRARRSPPRRPSERGSSRSRWKEKRTTNTKRKELWAPRFSIATPA